MQGFSKQFCWGINLGYRKSCANGFRIMGIAHILAVSGLSCLFDWHERLQRTAFWGISYGWAGLGASALLTFYGFVTGFGASVFRAVFMVEVSCLAAYLGRSYDLLSALSLSLILQAWQSPYLLFSAGLQLFWRGCCDWAGDGGAAESGKKEKRAGRGGTRERKKERI